MNLRNKRKKYTPPNPEIPEFSSPGGVDLWNLVLEIYYRQATHDAMLKILFVLVVGGLGAILARLLGAF